MAQANGAALATGGLLFMKIAYVATDLNALKVQSMIVGPYEELHYYLVQPKTRSVDVSIEDKSILAAGLCIPASTELQTSTHMKVLKKIQSHLIAWKREIFQDYKVKATKQNTHFEKNTQLKVLQHATDEISYIRMNRLNQKYIFEINGSEQREYDLVLFENNQFVMAGIVEKQQNLFYSFTEQTKCLLTLNFEISHLHNHPAMNEFLLVQNADVESIDDNWFVVQESPERLAVTFYVPLQMSSKEKFVQFMQTRTKQLVEERFSTFKINSYLGHSLSIGNGFYSHKARLRFKKNAVLVPSFKFWSDSDIGTYLKKIIQTKTSIPPTPQPPAPTTQEAPI